MKPTRARTYPSVVHLFSVVVVFAALAIARLARADTAAADTAPTIAREAPTAGGDGAPGPTSVLPSLVGPVGLYRVSTAETGPANHVRFALHGQYFKSSDFLIVGDTNSRLDGSLSFGYTPRKSLELFGALLASTNRNERDLNEVGRSDPEVLKSFGDLVLGGKGAFPIVPGFAAGPEVGLVFLSSVSGLAFSPSSTSFWVGGVASLDLGARTRVPLRFHVNASYLVDNSSNLSDLSGTSAATHRVTDFAYGIGFSRARVAVAADAPPARLGIPIQPFAEYHADIVTGSGDAAFAGLDGTHNRDQHYAVLGLRGHVYRGLTLDAGVDVRLRSVSPEYGPPLPPYLVTFGAAFPLDVAAFKRPVVVTNVVEKPAPITTGTVGGTVRGADGKPIADASVAFVGRAHAKIGTDADGSFASGPLAPGPVDVMVSAPGFEPTPAKAVVSRGDRSAMTISLPAVKPVTGIVRGRIVDNAGRGLNGTLRFAGAGNFEARSDERGAFSAVLPQGFYQAKIEAPGLPGRELPVDISAGQDRELDVTLRPANADVQVTGQTVVLRVPIKFRAGTPKLDAVTKHELDGVADLLADHAEIKTLRIQAHWSGTPGKTGTATDAAKKLTDDQAGTIKAYLIGKGVAGERLDAVGAGCESPLVPNLTAGDRTKNRRVELLLAN
jgi:outer membrane protein OmpA-like peptidoglycan-associated protein